MKLFDYIKENYKTQDINFRELRKQDCILFKGGSVFLEDCFFHQTDILVFEGKILALGEVLLNSLSLPKDRSIKICDICDYYLTPSLVEQHIHGAFGVNFNTCSCGDIINLMKKLFTLGVGTIIPTIMTDNIEKMNKQIEKINIAAETIKKENISATEIEGLHLEGPFINMHYKGIHPEKFILETSLENIKKINFHNIKICTFAPEKENANVLLQHLKKLNIIPSVGHSGASAENIEHAVDNGLKQVTHLFNAMPGIHHRNDSLTTEALINNSLYVEIIADTTHLSTKTLKLILQTKPSDKIIFISDALPLSHYEKESLFFGGVEIFKGNNIACNKTNTIAGSTLLLCDVFPVLKEKLNLDFKDFIKYTTINPATNLDILEKNIIKINSSVNLCFWKKDIFKVDFVF